uniref:CYSTM domain-containing protein n=1 Tax=Macrostomum lignano TaxID=282301 RepID=A0A1I8JR14_9PLAT
HGSGRQGVIRIGRSEVGELWRRAKPPARLSQRLSTASTASIRRRPRFGCYDACGIGCLCCCWARLLTGPTTASGAPASIWAILD